jgi:hypothetical protein
MAESAWSRIAPAAAKEEAMEAAARETEAAISLRNRLSEITIPRLNFTDTPAGKVLSVLQHKISELLGEKIIFKLDDKIKTDRDLPPVTFNVTDIPASDAVEAVCKGLGLLPVYGDNMIVLTEAVRK